MIPHFLKTSIDSVSNRKKSDGHRLLLLYILSFIVIPLHAQVQDIKLETEKFKAVVGFISDIFQDSKGFLWVADKNGLVKYDGYKYTYFQYAPENQNSISSTEVNCIAEDKDGKLWIGTRNGLNCFEPQTQRFSRFFSSNAANGISGDNIRRVLIDKDNNLWIISEFIGLDKMNLNTGKVYKYPYKNDSSTETGDNFFNDIVSGPEGKIWIADKAGLKCFDTNSETYKLYANDSLYPNSSDYTEGLSLELDGTILWIGTEDKGIGQFNTALEKFGKAEHELQLKYNIFNNDAFGITSICKQSDSCLLFSTHREGVFKATLKNQGEFKVIDRTTHYYIDKQEPNKWFTKVYIDRSGVVWVGSKGYGLMAIMPKFKNFNYIKNIEGEPNSLGISSVRAIYEEPNRDLWIGGYNCLDKIDRKTNTFTHFDGRVPYSICPDKDNSDILWIGMEGQKGLSTFNKKTYSFSFFLKNPEFEKIGVSVYSIIDNEDGTLWLGTNMGLRKFSKATGEVTYYSHEPGNANSILKGRVKSIVKDSYNKIWCGTPNGLSCFNIKTRTFENYTNSPNDPNSIGANSILSIYVDKSKTLWVGTVGGGLNRFNRENKTFIRYTLTDGFPSNIIIGILEDVHNNLWMTSDLGVIKFNPLSNESKLYDESDGLLNLSFNTGIHLSNKRDELFFCTGSGVLHFSPEEIEDNPFMPPVVLASLRIAYKDTTIGKDISTLDTLELDYKNEVITFEVSALNFIEPEMNHYKYMLEGYNNEWNDLGTKREITFSKPDHGHYVLHVIGSNNDGVWNYEGCKLHIIVHPPWWLTWWAKTLYFIFFAGSLLTIYFVRITRLKRQKQKLEQTVRQRTEELRNTLETISLQKEEIEAQAEELKYTNEKLIELDEFKQGMTGMIVHDLKNPLNGIINTPKSYSIEKQLLRTRQIGRQMLNMVLNILDVYKYQETRLIVDKRDWALLELSQTAIEEVTCLSEQKNITVNNQIVPGTGIKAEKEIIERVFINILTNAIKYTPNNGKIELTCFQNVQGFVKVEIADTGQGIPQSECHKVFDKFGQVSPKKSGTVRSTGLGLAFCKIAVEAHGGEIGVVSEVEKGTTFWFTLQSAEIVKNQRTDRSSASQIQTLSLSVDEKKILEPFLLQFKKHEIYNISILRNILRQIEPKENEQIKIWKEEMNSVIRSGNEERYKELIN